MTIICSTRRWGQTQYFSPSLIVGDDRKFLSNQIVIVAAGKNFSAAVDRYGHLFTFGDGNTCCLGHGDKENVKMPKLGKLNAIFFSL